METTLAILLYLNTICTCTYSQQQIDNIILVNDPQITAIENDPALTAQIEIEYGPLVTNIVIIDPEDF